MSPDGQDPQDQPAGAAPPARPPRPDPGPGIVIGRPLGIPVYVSPYWFLIAALIVIFYAGLLNGAVDGSVTRYLVATAFVVLLYLSVLIHELSHCIVARAFSLPVRRILLYPLGGLSEIEEEPQTPARAFLVSGAGPLLSLVLAAIGYGIIVAFGPGGIPRILIDQLILANIVVGILNLLPGLPLDGGWMLRAAVWKLTGKPGTGTIVAAWAGRGLAVALIAVPLAFIFRNGGGSGAEHGEHPLAGRNRRVHVGGRRRSPSGPPGSASGCQGCRPGGSPGAPFPFRRTCRWPRRSGARTPRRPGRWSSWTTRTRRSRSSTRPP